MAAAPEHGQTEDSWTDLVDNEDVDQIFILYDHAEEDSDADFAILEVEGAPLLAPEQLHFTL